MSFPEPELPTGKLDDTLPKLNGFQKPYHPLQVISWCIFAYLNISYHLVLGLQLSATFILLRACHATFSLIMFISAYLATNANVVDPYIAERGFPTPVMKINEFQQMHIKKLQMQEFYWCKYCQWYVTKKAKHCRSCNRCTCKFDHHCRWFNNCISDRNYKQFFTAIISSECVMLCGCLSGLAILGGYLQPDTHFLFSDFVFKMLIVSHVFIASFTMVPLTQLILFHLLLIHRQISTYDWVVQQEENKINRAIRKQHTSIGNKYKLKLKKKFAKRRQQRRLQQLNQKSQTETKINHKNEQESLPRPEDHQCDEPNAIQEKTNIESESQSVSNGRNYCALLYQCFRSYMYPLRDCELAVCQLKTSKHLHPKEESTPAAIDNIDEINQQQLDAHVSDDNEHNWEGTGPYLNQQNETDLSPRLSSLSGDHLNNANSDTMRCKKGININSMQKYATGSGTGTSSNKTEPDTIKRAKHGWWMLFCRCSNNKMNSVFVLDLRDGDHQDHKDHAIDHPKHVDSSGADSHNRDEIVDLVKVETLDDLSENEESNYNCNSNSNSDDSNISITRTDSPQLTTIVHHFHSQNASQEQSEHDDSCTDVSINCDGIECDASVLFSPAALSELNMNIESIVIQSKYMDTNTEY